VQTCEKSSGVTVDVDSTTNTSGAVQVERVITHFSVIIINIDVVMVPRPGARAFRGLAKGHVVPRHQIADHIIVCGVAQKRRALLNPPRFVSALPPVRRQAVNALSSDWLERNRRPFLRSASQRR